MKKFFFKYDKLEEYLLIGSLGTNVLLIFTQIIMRTLFNYSLSWTEELSRYIFIWQIWFGTSIAFKYSQHIRVEILPNFFKSERNKKNLEIVVNIIWLIFNIVLIYIGFLLCKSMLLRKVLSSGLRIPLLYVYICLPLSCLILIFRIVLNMYHLITKEN